MNIEEKDNKTKETTGASKNKIDQGVNKKSNALNKQAYSLQREEGIKPNISGEAIDKAKNYQSLNELEKRVVNQIEQAVNKVSKNVANPLIKKRNDTAVFFISGFDYLGLSPERNNGILQMSKVVPNSKHYFWNDKERIIHDIEKLPKDLPVILVGHSLGGDTALEVANDFNHIDKKFRKVNLIVTLDSVGFNNDIVPENVESNINFFGEKNVFFNDGPNAARNNERTKVSNHLRPEDHAELDNSDEVQREILDSIQQELKKAFEESQRS